MSQFIMNENLTMTKKSNNGIMELIINKT